MHAHCQWFTSPLYPHLHLYNLPTSPPHIVCPLIHIIMFTSLRPNIHFSYPHVSPIFPPSRMKTYRAWSFLWISGDSPGGVTCTRIWLIKQSSPHDLRHQFSTCFVKLHRPRNTINSHHRRDVDPSERGRMVIGNIYHCRYC